MNAPLKILKWMIENPDWHYGPEIAEGSHTSDVLIYIRVELLIGFGFAERRSRWEASIPGSLPRTQYRATLWLGSKVV